MKWATKALEENQRPKEKKASLKTFDLYLISNFLFNFYFEKQIGFPGDKGLRGPDGNKGAKADKGEKGEKGEAGDTSGEIFEKLTEEIASELTQASTQLNLQGNQIVQLKNTIDAQSYMIELQRNQILQQEKVLNHLILKMTEMGFEL